jgi:hypothetical protein
MSIGKQDLAAVTSACQCREYLWGVAAQLGACLLPGRDLLSIRVNAIIYAETVGASSGVLENVVKICWRQRREEVFSGCRPGGPPPGNSANWPVASEHEPLGPKFF